MLRIFAFFHCCIPKKRLQSHSCHALCFYSAHKFNYTHLPYVVWYSSECFSFLALCWKRSQAQIKPKGLAFSSVTKFPSCLWLHNSQEPGWQTSVWCSLINGPGSTQWNMDYCQHGSEGSAVKVWLLFCFKSGLIIWPGSCHCFHWGNLSSIIRDITYSTHSYSLCKCFLSHCWF